MPKRKTRDEVDVDVGDAPTAIDPYEILSLSPDATAEQIRSAYRRAALKHHPDKASAADQPDAHRRFQEVAFAYAMLSDERRRARYDRTGRTEDSLALDDADDFDWTSYFRAQFREVVTADAIDRFATAYRGGAEERAHVLAAYTKHRGDLTRLFHDVMLSDVLADEPRFRAILDAAIAAGEVDAFPAYTEESEARRRRRVENAKRKKEEEARGAEKAAKETEEDGRGRRIGKGKGDDADGTTGLAALIQQRQHNRADDFFANLEAKYAPSGKKGKRLDPVDEPPEEAFARNAKKAAGSTGDAVQRAGRSKRAKK